VVKVGDGGGFSWFTVVVGNTAGKTRCARAAAASASEVLEKVDGSREEVGGVMKLNVTLVVAEMIWVEGSDSEYS
jgi:hypothetical protein